MWMCWMEMVLLNSCMETVQTLRVAIASQQSSSFDDDCVNYNYKTTYAILWYNELDVLFCFVSTYESRSGFGLGVEMSETKDADL